MVGAVVARGSPAPKIMGEGYHHRFGEPHAEVHALAAAGGRARGGTLYVTLEPCCHWGKTPPCTEAILAAGVRRVVVAMVDPFPQVAGKGIARLRRQGVRVDVGLLGEEAARLNAPFVTRITGHRPYVIAKWAQSIDGCIATATGESKWISSEESRQFVQGLRGRVDGILVGIGTALADDPLLMARPNRGRDIRRLATRIVLDAQCRLPVDGQMVRTIPVAPLLMVHAENLVGAAAKRQKVLQGKGVMTLAVPADAAGKLRLKPLLSHLAGMDYTNILVEGGGHVLASFFDDGFVDEAHVFMAPILIGGPNARRPVAGPDLRKLADAQRFRIVDHDRCGPDIHLVMQPGR